MRRMVLCALMVAMPAQAHVTYDSGASNAVSEALEDASGATSALDNIDSDDSFDDEDSEGGEDAADEPEQTPILPKDLAPPSPVVEAPRVGRDGHFMTPNGLIQDVAFWESVFRDYTPDQCIFHDKNDLSIIYAIKTLPGDTVRQQARAIKRYLAALRDAIKWLADAGEPRNLLEKRIVQVTEPRLRYPAYWRYAMDNVRCQRGVDLVPSLTRAKTHLKMVKRILAEQGLPTDLAYLPHLESGYNVTARSRAGARGLWQLMPATARLVGLKVSGSHDFRINPLKATEAAAGMLREFFSRTRDWPLAITAYNYGINGMARAIKLYGNDYMTVRRLHHTRLFGFAVRNYYPSFLAVRNVAMAAETPAARAAGAGH